MTANDAIQLITGAVQRNSLSQRWADLGAGTGTFTSALSSLLTTGSTIYAIDADESALSDIRLQNKNVKLISQIKNFEMGIEDLPFLDGILLANSLHYLEEQDRFLEKIKTQLKPAGVVVIVEYDKHPGNKWVPFPLSYNHLVRMAEHSGYREVKKISERPSSFGNINMYCAVLKK